MTDSALVRQPTTCPTCEASLQHVAGFVTWCPACGWNASPAKPEPQPEGRLARMECRLTNAAGTRLFEQLRGRPIAAPTWTPSRLLALGVAIGEPGSISLTDDQQAAIDGELAPYVPELQRQLYAELTYVR